MTERDDKHLKSVDGAVGEVRVPDDSTAGPEQKPKLSRREKFRSRGIFLLPNLITTGALFAGFYAIVAGMNGDFLPASLAIFVAIALDTADGKVARITHTESEFGAQYDSLSDMVAFGVAPALVAFSWGLSSLGKAGWVATFVYMACAALRLARFNTKGDNASFTGLASPSAAAIIACSILVWVEYVGGQPSILAAAFMAAVTVCVALLMVSNFEYFSPKNIDFKGRVPFVTLVFVVLGFSLMLIDPPTVLLTLAVGYAISGPLQFLWRRVKSRD
ncbi:MAG: phosphatidylcholine/phosphatidylserine synthase [Gammaproteobacteria bacterium]|nr:phosphatidylcholine/phosphatidylserine synthase [Gammaproteobacteria bacterium]